MKTDTQIKKIALQLTGLVAKDLNGLEYKIVDAGKNIGNLLYMHHKTIEEDELSRKIHAGGSVEVSSDELLTLSALLESNPIYLPFVQRTIINHINSLITTLGN